MKLRLEDMLYVGEAREFILLVMYQHTEMAGLLAGLHDSLPRGPGGAGLTEWPDPDTGALELEPADFILLVSLLRWKVTKLQALAKQRELDATEQATLSQAEFFIHRINGRMAILISKMPGVQP